MEIIALPHLLAIAYGAIILGGGATLGFIAGRNLRSPRNPSLGPSDPEGVDRRVRRLEDELDATQQQLDAARDEADFYRRLIEERPDAVERDGRAAA